jgi:NAD(P)-dependent dehydrogenase (short-subunit alcohol dehydrogenase family)
LTKQSEVNRIGEFYNREFPHAPDIVVNNAGILRTRDWLEVPEEEFDEVIATNLKAVHMV